MKQIVIIGNSAAGINAAQAIREQDNQIKIIIISDENQFGYCRCLISDMLAGKLKEKDLIIKDNQFYKDLNIQLLKDTKVEKINPNKKNITLENRTRIDYDSLIIATGAVPKISKDIKGINKHGVFGFRSINDIRDILEIIPITRTACVVGGGLIGLKAAYGLKAKRLQVKLIVRSNYILSQILDEPGADFFKERFEKEGIEIISGRDIVEVFGNGDVKAIKLNSGKVIGCGIVIIGKGVVPNIKLIKETQIKYDRGILTDEFMRTNIADVFAAGDVAQGYDILRQSPGINALWPAAVEQGKIAGLNAILQLLGNQEKMIRYEGSLSMNAVEFFDLPVISIGTVNPPQGADYEELVFTDKPESVYKKILLKDNRIVGFISIGKINNSGIFLKLIKKKADVSRIKNCLLSEMFSYPMVKDLIGEEEENYV